MQYFEHYDLSCSSIWICYAIICYNQSIFYANIMNATAWSMKMAVLHHQLRLNRVERMRVFPSTFCQSLIKLSSYLNVNCSMEPILRFNRFSIKNVFLIPGALRKSTWKPSPLYFICSRKCENCVSAASISIASFLFCWCFHHNFVSGCLLKCSMFPIQCVCSTFSHPTNRPLNRSHNALSKYIIIWFALPLLLHQIHFVFGSFRKLFFWAQHLNAWMGPVIWLRFSYFFFCLLTSWMEVQILCYIVHFAPDGKPYIVFFVMFGQFLVANWSDDAFCTR